MVTDLETSIPITLVVFSASEIEGFLGIFGLQPEIRACASAIVGNVKHSHDLIPFVS
jgi:hypothetical protein